MTAKHRKPEAIALGFLALILDAAAESPKQIDILSVAWYNEAKRCDFGLKRGEEDEKYLQ